MFTVVLYCRGGFEIVDGVSLCGRKGGKRLHAVKQGKFVREADGVHLVFVMEGGRRRILG